MRSTIYVLFLASTLVLNACSKDSSDGDLASLKARNKEGYLSRTEALSVSALGITCEQVIQVPLSRGQGSGLDGKYRTEVRYFPGFLRGDVNSDGKITVEDARMAVHKLFKLTDVVCPATADIAGYPNYIGKPDGAVTSIDITSFNDFKHTGQITWPQDIICSYACDVINQPPGSY